MARKLDPKVAEAVMLKAGLKPLEPYKGADSKWKCTHITCGQIVFPTYSNIKYGFGPCKSCGINSRAKKRTISEKKAIALMVKHDLEPRQPYKSARGKWKCKCMKCGKIVHPTYNKIQQGRGGCKDCGVKVRVQKSKKPEDFVIKEMLKARIKPLEPYKNANTPWKCECLRCGKSITPTYSGVQQGRGGCKHCGGNYVDPKDARKFMISKGYKPRVPYVTVHKKWECIHIPCGNIVSPQYAQIQQGMGGCRHCAEWGFQYDKESYVYLITHPDLNAHKVGIANIAKRQKDDRLRRHQISGWVAFKVWNFNDGKVAEIIEKEVFKILNKDMEISQYLSKMQMPQGGETETIDADSITLLQLEKIIKKVIKRLQE